MKLLCVCDYTRVPSLIRQLFEHRPHLLGDATVAAEQGEGGEDGHVQCRQKPMKNIHLQHTQI